MTKSWQRPPYDMKLQIYLFNVISRVFFQSTITKFRSQTLRRPCREPSRSSKRSGLSHSCQFIHFSPNSYFFQRRNGENLQILSERQPGNLSEQEDLPLQSDPLLSDLRTQYKDIHPQHNLPGYFFEKIS